MSKTRNPNPRTLHAAPEPATPVEPLTGFTGAPAALYTELAVLTEPATTAELALAAGLGRSTAGKALVTLEAHGLATRIPGGHDGPRRTPNRWQPAPAAGTATAETEAPRLPTSDSSVDTDEKHVEATPLPNASTCSDETAAPEPETPSTTPTAPGSPTAPAPEQMTAPTEPTPAPANTATSCESPDPTTTAPAHEGDSGEAPSATPTTSPAREPAVAQANASGAATPASPSASTTSSLGTGTGQDSSAPVPATPEPTLPLTAADGKRLAPGGLRQMVIDHLADHPDEAFTATKISRAIERSSGAIANALVTLTKQGIAEQVTDRPRTYRGTGSVTHNP